MRIITLTIFCYFFLYLQFFKCIIDLKAVLPMIEQQPKLGQIISHKQTKQIKIKQRSVRSQQKQNNQEHQQSLSSISSNTVKNKLPLIILKYIMQQAKQNRQNKSTNTSNINYQSNPNKLLKIASKISQNKKVMSKYNLSKCQICALDVPDLEKSSMSGCDHKYCDSCLQQYVIYKISKFQAIQCPFEGCKKFLYEKSKCYLSLPLEARKKYKKIKQYSELLKNPNKKLCPNQICEGFLQTLPSEQGIMRIANPKCNTCLKIYCSNCMFEQHQGQCDPHQLTFFQNTLHYRQCNKCKSVIDKSAGCNHMTCRCGYQFCYICGRHWSSGHLCNNPDQQPLLNEVECDCCCINYNLTCCECCETCCNSFQDCMGGMCDAICDGCCAPCCEGLSNCCESICKSCSNSGCCQVITKILFFFLWILILVPAIYLQMLMMLIFRFLSAIFIGIFGFPCLLSQNGIQYQWYHIVLSILFFPITMFYFIWLALKLIFQDEGNEQLSELLCLPCSILSQCI